MPINLPVFADLDPVSFLMWTGIIATGSVFFSIIVSRLAEFLSMRTQTPKPLDSPREEYSRFFSLDIGLAERTLEDANHALGEQDHAKAVLLSEKAVGQVLKIIMGKFFVDSSMMNIEELALLLEEKGVLLSLSKTSQRIHQMGLRVAKGISITRGDASWCVESTRFLLRVSNEVPVRS